MSVNQLSFFALFFLSVIFYYCVPRKCQWMALLGISLLFYHLMGVDNFIYVLVTAGTLTWTTGRMYRIDVSLEKKLKNTSVKLTRSEKKEKKSQAKKTEEALASLHDSCESRYFDCAEIRGFLYP